MRSRVRSKWRKKDRAVTFEDNAVALAAGIWRVSLAAAKNLHAHDFVYEGDEQRLQTIEEYLAFLIHVADRLAFDTMDQHQRCQFVSTLAHQCGRHIQQNKSEIFNADDYQSPFINTLNERMSEYSETVFNNAEPGYDTYRCFARHVQEVMGMDQTNRWVTDHIIEIDAPEAVATLTQTMQRLFASAPIEVASKKGD